jgi:hypothetical protein
MTQVPSRERGRVSAAMPKGPTAIRIVARHRELMRTRDWVDMEFLPRFNIETC